MLRLGSSPCKNRGDKIAAAVLPLISAGMVELVDSEDLGAVTSVKNYRSILGARDLKN